MVKNQKNEEISRINEKGDFKIKGRLYLGTPTHPTRITIYDSITGQPYCIKIANGEWLKQKGECKY